MIHEEGGLQIIDFGVAGTLESKTDRRNTVIGTPHWMAPELLHGAIHDGRKDHGREVSIPQKITVKGLLTHGIVDKVVRSTYGRMASRSLRWPQATLQTLEYHWAS